MNLLLTNKRDSKEVDYFAMKRISTLDKLFYMEPVSCFYKDVVQGDCKFDEIGYNEHFYKLITGKYVGACLEGTRFYFLIELESGIRIRTHEVNEVDRMGTELNWNPIDYAAWRMHKDANSIFFDWDKAYEDLEKLGYKNVRKPAWEDETRLINL